MSAVAEFGERAGSGLVEFAGDLIPDAPLLGVAMAVFYLVGLIVRPLIEPR